MSVDSGASERIEVMNRGKLCICFVISLIVIGFTLLTYGEVVENTIMGMIQSGTMPERYHGSEGWGLNYEPVENFLILSAAFIVLFYGICLCSNDLLMNLWGRKWSPRPIPPPS